MKTLPSFRVPASLLTVTLLAACMPAHRTIPTAAKIDAPAQWRTQLTDTEVLTTQQWWRAFDDSELNRYVETALTNNTNIHIAATRVEAARAQAQLAEASSGPILSMVTAGKSEHTLTTVGILKTHAVQPTLQLNWELDLWGRLKQQSKAAEFQLLASQAERDAAQLSIASTTAQTYITYLTLKAQYLQTLETERSRAEALRIADDRHRLGYISHYQLTQAQAEYEAVKQALPQLELAIVRQNNALQLLIGEMPSEATGLMTQAAQEGTRLKNLTLPKVPAALPSELLKRRPDIVQSELQLSASDATLKARRLAFLPQVSLSAAWGGLYANALRYNPIEVWNIGGSILAPIFDQGRLNAQYDFAASQRDQAAFAYRGVVLNAFNEVENALVGVKLLTEQLSSVEQRREVLLQSVNHARDRYEMGYASYLELMDAQRNLYQTEIELINVKQAQLLNMLNLYKALGGGWQAAATP